MNKTLMGLSNYVNSASDLAEFLKEDLKKGLTISDSTILALNRFMKAAHSMKELKENLIQRLKTLN